VYAAKHIESISEIISSSLPSSSVMYGEILNSHKDNLQIKHSILLMNITCTTSSDYETH
jgi:hypothetical protein